jgi:acyl carrier protein
MTVTLTRGEVEMSSQNVAERVTSRVKEQLDLANSDVDRAKVVPSASLIDDLRFDTLDLTELRGLLEQEFGIQIDGTVREQMLTVNDWIVYCQANGAT